ncbi:MAG: hypothetical protein KUG80_03255 [Gammaproteobacteria bacterium]|nr:hypothetical protein [Gammaproteobacteria bacterium]
MALIDRVLSRTKLSCEVVNIYREHISEEALTGVIFDYNDNFLYMRIFTTGGMENAISVFSRSDITKIHVGGSHKKLIDSQRPSHRNNLNFPHVHLFSFGEIISSMQNHFDSIVLHTEHINKSSAYMGKVLEQDVRWITLPLDEQGIIKNNNTLLLDKENITRIDSGMRYNTPNKKPSTDSYLMA